MESMVQDLRYALRLLVRKPGFAIVAALTLGLGIGANTALFTVVNAVLLRPLPFLDPERLVLLWRSQPQQGRDQIPFSYPNFADLREQARSFEGMSACTFRRFNATDDHNPEQVQAGIVSADIFTVLGVTPILGRGFVAAEDNPGVARVVVLSHTIWQRRYGSDPDVLKRAIVLDGETYHVVGVLPPSFRFYSLPAETEVWIPFGLDPFRDRRYARPVNSLAVIGRLKTGIKLKQARAELDTLAAQLERQYPEANSGWKVRVVSLQEQTVHKSKTSLVVLLVAVGFVLLIACSNVASLTLARAWGRRKEMAIRAALGAGRARLIRQLLFESIVLALLGGAIGFLLSLWGVELLIALPYRDPDFYTPYVVPREAIRADQTVLAFTSGISLLSAVIFGLAPAFKASRINPDTALKGAGGYRAAGVFGRSALVVAEIALTVVLSVGAGLLMKSFFRLTSINPGFDAGNVLAADVSLPESRYADPAVIARTYNRILERVKAIPGVVAAGAVEYLPLSGADGSTAVFLDGKPRPAEGSEPRAHYRDVTPDYFAAMGIRRIKGRGFTEQDGHNAPRVTIVNETLARRFWPGEDPIGKRLALNLESLRYFPNRAPELDWAQGMREVVGIVSDVRHSRLESEAVPEMYIPHSQRPIRNMSLVVRASTDPAVLAAALRREVLATDPDLPVSNIASMSQHLADAVSQPRFNLFLLSSFSSIALVLAAVGVYGLLSFSVAQRIREIGIRMALGASRRDVVRLILTRGMVLGLTGVILGAGAAFWLTRLIGTLLFDVRTTDPSVYGIVSALLLAVSLVACYLPARRGTNVNPVEALRQE